QRVELTDTNRPCGLVILLLDPDVAQSPRRPGSSSVLPSHNLARMQAPLPLHRARGAEVSGGYIGGVPPVPIPNTEVKPSRADGTARFPCGRVGRCRNFIKDAPPRFIEAPRGVAFCGPHLCRYLMDEGLPRQAPFRHPFGQLARK